MPARSWQVRVEGLGWGGSLPPDKATTHAEAAAAYRKLFPMQDHYWLTIHRLGDPKERVERFAPVKAVA